MNENDQFNDAKRLMCERNSNDTGESEQATIWLPFRINYLHILNVVTGQESIADFSFNFRFWSSHQSIEAH